jgi:hypothetical protein
VGRFEQNSRLILPTRLEECLMAIPHGGAALPLFKAVAVKEVISVRSQARGVANDWLMDGKPGLRYGTLEEPPRLAGAPTSSSEREPMAREASAPIQVSTASW